jgi:hypothetical protein
VDSAIESRVLKLRIRNNIIDYLGLASSPFEQREYERKVPIAQVPLEVLIQWEDWFWKTDLDWYATPEFSVNEQNAMREFDNIWKEVAEETLDNLPYTIEALLGTPVWQRLIDAARVALSVFERRGRIEETSPL